MLYVFDILYTDNTVLTQCTQGGKKGKKGKNNKNKRIQITQNLKKIFNGNFVCL